jgi:hypothetical protein
MVQSVIDVNLHYMQDTSHDGFSLVPTMNSGEHSQTLDPSRCGLITDTGPAHVSALAQMQALYLCQCEQLTDAGLNEALVCACAAE